MALKRLYLYDFDGTLTSKDSLLAFLMFTKGKVYTLLLLALYSPLLVLMVLGLYSNGKAKERIFSHCFKGMLLRDFDLLCEQFAKSHISILRTNMLKDIENALDEGGHVMVVSASIRNWVSPMMETFFGKSLKVVGTEIEVAYRRLTGRFITPNCHGKEKVNRIKALIPDRQNYYIVAYGDSRGDREMLAWADEGHLINEELRMKNEEPDNAIISHSKDFSSSILHSSFIRFGIVGVIAVVIQYLVYLLMLHFSPPGIANTVAYVVSFIFNFFASTYFTFRVKANARRGAGFAFSHLINYFMQMGSLYLFLWMGIGEKWAPIPMFCVCVPVNYLLVRYFLTR